MERFWSKVALASPAVCWEWQRSTDDCGYGLFRLERKLWRAHILSLTWDMGPPPPGKPLALHTCDNPPCVNPEHLYWGSAKKNAQDRADRDRHVALTGEAHRGSKLTEADVLAIRYVGRSVPLEDLARKFGVSTSAISRILLRKTWKHL